ncbi:hypothetical protein EB796_013485 [Bugula neritina]|uniref:Uncharacterized protein n=1 Tax=Bugula neritina TaxID=10212 RepID=A0A7J7JS00_BUGNE|nr:hypothetical protein EB796_013485 [Bugula neritina]
MLVLNLMKYINFIFMQGTYFLIETIRFYLLKHFSFYFYSIISVKNFPTDGVFDPNGTLNVKLTLKHHATIL